MPLVFNFAAQSDVGRVRAKNDDSGYAGRNLAVVADGMGGHVGGDVASSSTVLDLIHLDAPDIQDAGTLLPDEIQTANSILNELVRTNPKLSGMGTTCTAILLSGDTIHLSHVGDSRAYRLKDDQFEQVSKDHSFVQRLIDEGRIQPEEAETHPHKNVLMRVLGDVDASPELDVSSHEVAAGERWLLCSDGLNAVLSDSSIESAMRSDRPLNDICLDLIEATLAGGAPDNVTVILVDVADSPVSASPQAPAAPLSAERSVSSEAPDAPSGALLRQELSTRPHSLVGAADLATQTGKIPIVTQRSVQQRAAQMMLTHHEDEDEFEPIPDYQPRRSWLLPTFVTLLAVLLAVVTWWGYAWTQTQYYVGEQDGKVAIFNGVSQSIGPMSLSHVDSQTEIAVDALPTYTRQRVESGLPARDLSHAQQIVGELAQSIVTPEPTPSPTPSPSPSPTETSIPTPQTTSPTPTRTSPTSTPTGGDH